MLEYVLNSRQKVVILRFLAARQDWIFSLSEISRELSIPKNTAARSIKPLVEYNILREFKKGKSTVFQLNNNNYIVKKMLYPLFQRESEYPLQKASEFCAALRKWILVGAVFGSASRREMTPASDIDLALISENPEVVERNAAQLKSEYLKQEGLLFSVHIYRPSEFKRRYAKKDPLFMDIANGIIVFGDVEKVI